MKVLMLGMEAHSGIFDTMKKLFALEKVGSDIVFFDDCNEEQLKNKLRNHELFFMHPYNFNGKADSSISTDETFRYETIAAGYVLAHAGRFMLFSPDPDSLSDIFFGEPVVSRIGEAIGYFRREKKIYESNKKMFDARRVISEAHLSFSQRGFVEAIEYGMYKESQAFLNAGFSTETENEAGVPILSIAVRNGDLELCRLLMSYDAALNIIARDRVTSPVIDAVTASKPEIAELLIDAGADLNFRNRNGQSALIVAIGSRMEDVSHMLIEKGADVNIKDSLGMTAYDYAKLFSLTDLKEKLEKMK